MDERKTYKTAAYYAEHDDCWKGRKFGFLHGDKLVLAYRNDNHGIWGFSAKISDINRFNPEALLSMDYRELSIKILKNSGMYFANIMMLLALSDGVKSIKADGISKKDVTVKCSFSRSAISNGQVSVITSDINDDERTIILTEEEADLTISEADYLDGLDAVLDEIIMPDTSVDELSAFICWIGSIPEEKKDSFLFSAIINHAQYDVISYLVDSGYGFGRITNNNSNLRAGDSDEDYLKVLDIFSRLAKDNKLGLSIEETARIILFAISNSSILMDTIDKKIRRNYVPHLEYFRNLDTHMSVYLKRILCEVPDDVFHYDNDAILYAALDSFSMFPKSFRVVAEHYSLPYSDGNQILERMYAASSHSVASRLNYNVLMERASDYRKEEAGSVLYFLIQKSPWYVYTARLGEYILYLLRITGLDYTDALGYTPFTWAYRQTQECIEDYGRFMKLLEMGSDINSKGYSDRTVLSEIIKGIAESSSSLELRDMKILFEYFILSDADPSILSAGRNAAHELAELCQFSEHDWHIFDSLEDKSFLTALDTEGRSPLMIASENLNREAAVYLIKGGYVRDDEKEKLQLFIESIMKDGSPKERKEELRSFIRLTGNSNRNYHYAKLEE